MRSEKARRSDVADVALREVQPLQVHQAALGEHVGGEHPQRVAAQLQHLSAGVQSRRHLVQRGVGAQGRLLAVAPLALTAAQRTRGNGGREQQQ